MLSIMQMHRGVQTRFRSSAVAPIIIRPSPPTLSTRPPLPPTQRGSSAGELSAAGGARVRALQHCLGRVEAARGARNMRLVLSAVLAAWVLQPSAVVAQPACDRCNPGQEPSPDGLTCVDCTGTTYSPFGAECVACSAPFVINSQRTTCSACQPGEGPNSGRDGCDACTGSTYSPYGAGCADCFSPNIVSTDKISCTRPGCGLGQECTGTDAECLSDPTNNCADCAAGKVSLGAECTQCEPGKIPNDAKDACTSCVPGRIPNAARTACERCPEGKYSAYGVACNACEKGKYVDAVANCTFNCGKILKYPSSGCNSCGEGKYVWSAQVEAALQLRIQTYNTIEQQADLQQRESFGYGGYGYGGFSPSSYPLYPPSDYGNPYPYSNDYGYTGIPPPPPPFDGSGNVYYPPPAPGEFTLMCAYTNDGECDEGSYCSAGTDSDDCCTGTQVTDPGSYPFADCSNADASAGSGSAASVCQYTYDGECDETTYCAAGTDSFDCCTGDQVTDPGNYPNADCSNAASAGADSVCQWTDDGECDETTFCAAGTDSNDCCTGNQVTDPGSYPNADCSNAGRRRRMQDAPAAGDAEDTGPPTCGICPAGFVPTKTRDDCEECAPGKVANIGDATCEFCDALTENANQESFRESQLQQRPSGWKDSGTSDQTASSCVCMEGYYNQTKQKFTCYESDFKTKGNTLGEDAATCQPCGDCLTCYRGVAVIKPIYTVVFSNPEEGAQSQIDIFRCAGGGNGCNTVKDLYALPAGCKTCANPTLGLEEGCLANYTGHMCSVCKDKFEPKTLNGVERCLPCPPQDGSSFKVLAGFIVVAFVMWIGRKSIKKFLYARLGENDLVAERRLKTFKATLRSSWQPVRILVSYAQVTSQLGPVLDIPYPPMFQSLTIWLKDSLEVLDVFASAKCLGLDTFHYKYFMQVLALPTMLVLAAYVVFLLQQHTGSADAGKNFKGSCFFIAFFCYPKMCNFSFATFICRKVTEETSILIADDRMLCEDPAHVLFKYGSIAIIVLVAAGVPIATAIFLRRDAMSRKDRGVSDTLRREVAAQWQVSLDEAEIAVNDTRLGSPYGFLVDAYKPRFYYAESLDMIRKLLLVGMVLAVERGSVAQLLVALIVSIVFTTGHANACPYKIHEDNVLRLTTEFHIFMLISVALAFQTDLDSPWAVQLKGGAVCDRVCKQRYRDDFQDRKDYYDWILMVSFVVMVPGAFFACVFYKARNVMRALSSTDGTDGTQGMIMKSAYLRYKLGLAQGSDHKDLVYYFDSLDVSDHVRAGHQLWRTKEIISHYTRADVSNLAKESQQKIPKSETIGLHFTDLNSARLILHSRGIRASPVGQLGGGVSICLQTLDRLGWGTDSYTKNIGDALWGSKWYEVMEGSAPLMKLRIKAPQHELDTVDHKELSSCSLVTELKTDLAAALNTNDSSTLLLSADNIKVASFTRDAGESGTIEFFISPPALTADAIKLLPDAATKKLLDLLEDIQDLEDEDFMNDADVVSKLLRQSSPKDMIEQFQTARAELIRNSLAASRAKLRSELGNPHSTLMKRAETGAKCSIEPGQELTLEPPDEKCAVDSAASSAEWGSWANKLEVVFFVRIPSRENRDPARIVPGRDDVYIIPKADCVPDEKNDNFFLSNTKIVKCLILKPPSINKIEESRKFVPRWLPCKPSQEKASRQDHNLFKSGGGDQTLRKEPVTRGDKILGLDLVKQVRYELVGSRRKKYRVTYDCVWPPTQTLRVELSSLGSKAGMTDNVLRKVQLTDRVDDFMLGSEFPPRIRRTVATIGPARQQTDPILTLHLAQSSVQLNLWDENIARFTKDEMRAAIKALDQELLQAYSLGFYYCSMTEAKEVCSPGSGITGKCTPLAPTDLGWVKNAQGDFQERAMKAMNHATAGPVEAVLVFAVPNCDEISRGHKATLDLSDKSVFDRIRIIERTSDGEKQVCGDVDTMDAAVTLTFESFEYREHPDSKWQYANVLSTDREHNLIEIAYGNSESYRIPLRYLTPRNGNAEDVAQPPAVGLETGIAPLDSIPVSETSDREKVYSNAHVRKWYRLVPEAKHPDEGKTKNLEFDTTEKPPDSLTLMHQHVSYLEAIPFALQLAGMARSVRAWRKRSSAGSTVVPAVGTGKDELSPRSASYKSANNATTDLASDTLVGAPTDGAENV